MAKDKPYDTYLEAINSLKPCKHCGGNSLIIRSCLEDSYTPGQFYVHCHDCKRETKDVHPTQMGAVRQWNQGDIV